MRIVRFQMRCGHLSLLSGAWSRLDPAPAPCLVCVQARAAATEQAGSTQLSIFRSIIDESEL